MDAAIQKADSALHELRIQFEQYFSGVSRRPPLAEEDTLRQAIIRLRTQPGLGPGLRFRVEGLHQRFMSYQRMWARTLREIEEGTYRKDLAKARRRNAIPAPMARGSGASKGVGEGAGGDGSMDDGKLRRLYSAWVEARGRCNDPTEAPSFEKMASSIRKQVPMLLEKHGAKSVDFQVVIREGKAVLKAVPKG